MGLTPEQISLVEKHQGRLWDAVNYALYDGEDEGMRALFYAFHPSPECRTIDGKPPADA